MPNTLSPVPAAIGLALLTLPLTTPFAMPLDDQPLPVMVVTATRTPITADDTLAAVSVIDRGRIEASQAASVDELLRLEAGVHLARNGGHGKQTSLYLRGSNANHVLVLIDGVRAGSATLGTYAWSHLTPDQIERIEVVRGPRSSLYGSDAVGGVIQIFTRRDTTPTHARLRVGGHGLRELAAGLSFGEKARIGLNAGTQRSDGIPTVRSDSDDRGYRNDHFSATLDTEIGEESELSLTLNHAEGRSNNDPNTGDIDFENRVVAATLSHPINERWLTTLTLGHTLDRSESHSPFIPATITTKRLTLGWQNDVELGDGLLTLGLDHHSDEATKDRSGTIDRALDANALYAQYQIAIDDDDWLFGLRHDDHQSFGGHSTWNLTWGRALSDSTRITAGVGTAYKAPTVNDLYWPHSRDSFYGTTYITQGSPGLTPEEAASIELGLEHHLSHPWGPATLRANLFANDVENLIEWSSTQTGTTEYTYRPTNIGEAEIRGLELSYGTTGEGWELDAALTLLSAEDATDGRQLDRRPERTLALRGGLDLGRGRLLGEWLAVSERNDREGRTQLDGYGLLNLAYRHPLSDGWTLEGRVENLLDRDYILASSFSGDYSTLGRTLYLGVRYQAD